MSLFSYLDQLQQAADAAGVDLAEACRRAGIASTTLQRWRNGDVTPRKATAEDVLTRIREIAAERAAERAAEPERAA